MFNPFRRRRSLQQFEIDAINTLYAPMGVGPIDWESILEPGEFERPDENVYRVCLILKSRRVPRIWEAVVLKGTDPSGNCCARMAVYEFHGVPWCITVTQEHPGSGERQFDFPVTWRVVYPRKYFHDLPLPGELIEKFEWQARFHPPQDLVQFLTSPCNARLSRAIEPFDNVHVVDGSDGHSYYLIFALAGKMNLFVRLGKNGARPVVSETFLVEENIAGYPPYEIGIDEAVARFIREYGEELYI